MKELKLVTETVFKNGIITFLKLSPLILALSIFFDFRH